MKKNLFCIIPALVLLYIHLSCTAEKQSAKQQVEPPLVYNGIAVITEIRDAKSGAGGDDKNYTEIYFDFVPLKNGVPAYSEIESTGRMIKLFYDNREIFHRNWVKKWDIKSGNEYPALRRITRKENKLNYVTYEVFIEPDKKNKP